MAAKAIYFGLADVLAFYDSNELPYFSIWDKTQKITQYNGLRKGEAEKSEGREKLEAQLKAFEKSNFDHELRLCIHPDFEVSYDWRKSPIVEQGLFCISDTNKPGETAKNLSGNNDRLVDYLMNENALLKEKNEALMLELSEYQAEDESEDIGSVTPPETMIDQITKLANNPAVMGLIQTIFSPAPTPRATALAGVNDVAEQEEIKELQSLINTLFAKGVTIEHLRKLAAMPAAKIKSLLFML